MRNTLLGIAVLILAIASCKKEDSAAKNPTLLTKVVTKVGTDSTVTTYSYDSQNRFTTETTVDNTGGTTETTTISVVRDANGRISRTVENTSGSSTGTYLTDYTYLGSDRKIRNGLFKFDFSGQTVTDSIAFTYGTKVSKTTHFYSATGLTQFTAYYYEYTYDAKGNMTIVKIYQATSISGPLVLQSTFSFEFDDKVNPIYFNEDALVEYIVQQYVSPNNVKKLSVVDADPTNNYSATVTYEYNADGRPSKATFTSGGSTAVSTYTYKN